MAFACLVVVANNLSTLWSSGGIGQQELADGLIKVALWGAIFGWMIRVERLSAVDLGMRVGNLWRSAGWGLMAGLGMALPGLVFLAFPVLISQPVRITAAPDLERMAPSLGLLLIALVNTSAIFEEVLFRGMIQELGIRIWGPVWGIAASVALFVFWHVVVVYQGIQLTNLTSAVVPWPILYTAAAVPLAIAGLIFSLLRYRTANLAGPTVAHWLVNSLMQGYVFLSSTGVV